MGLIPPEEFSSFGNEGESPAGGPKKTSGPRPLLLNRTIDRILVLLIPAALFVYASHRTVVRLRVGMPPEFVDAPASASPKQRAMEERIAQAYWNCTLSLVQWTHTYGSTLPEGPPEGFRIDDKALGLPGVGAASRMRYWRRLRQIWLSPEAWSSSQEWSTSWLTEPIAKWVEEADGYFKRLWKVG